MTRGRDDCETCEHGNERIDFPACSACEYDMVRFSNWRPITIMANIHNADGSGGVVPIVEGDPLVRRNAGKLRWGLLMGAGVALRAIIEVLEMGAKKYADNAWKGMADGFENSKESLYRHLAAVEENGPGSIDEESGKLDLAHMGCNIIFMLWFQLTGKGGVK